MGKEEVALKPRVLQLGFGGELSLGVDQITSLEQLLPIASSLRRFSPLAIVTSLSQGPSGRLDVLPAANFARGEVTVSSSIADLASASIKEPKGIVFLLDWPFGNQPTASEEELSGLRSYLGALKEKREARVWLIEGQKRSCLDEAALAARKHWLEKIGLVDPDFRSPMVNKKEGLRLIYTVARPAIKPERHETSIAQKTYVKAIMRELAEGLETEGYEVVSWDKIRDLLSATRFPPDATARLRAGFGIVVRHHCGICHDYISIQGAVTRLTQCDNPQCAQLLEEIKKITRLHNRVVLGHNMPYDLCPSCHHLRFLTRTTWDDDGKSKLVEIREYLTCPSHPDGSSDHGMNRFKVTRKLANGQLRLIRYADLDQEEQRLAAARRVRI